MSSLRGRRDAPFGFCLRGVQVGVVDNRTPELDDDIAVTVVDALLAARDARNMEAARMWEEMAFEALERGGLLEN